MPARETDTDRKIDTGAKRERGLYVIIKKREREKSLRRFDQAEVKEKTEKKKKQKDNEELKALQYCY